MFKKILCCIYRVPRSQLVPTQCHSLKEFSSYAEITIYFIVSCDFCKTFTKISSDIWWKTETFLDLVIIIMCHRSRWMDWTNQLWVPALHIGSLSLYALASTPGPVATQIFSTWLTLGRKKRLRDHQRKEDTIVEERANREMVESGLRMSSAGWQHGQEKQGED